jgi:uncharacterized membrane protein HdeD (DUF308 family)
MGTADVRVGGVRSVGLRRSWEALLLAGILLIVTGALAIALPAVFALSIAVLLGILLLVIGVAWLVSETSHHAGSGGRTMSIVLAALVGLAGLWMLLRPWEATVTLTAVLVGYFVITGALRILVAARRRGERDALLIGLGGVLSLIVGILVGSELPSSASWAIGLLVGIQFLFDGVGLIAVALTLRGPARTRTA